MTESLYTLATKQLEVEDIDMFMIIMDQWPGNCATPATVLNTPGLMVLNPVMRLVLKVRDDTKYVCLYLRYRGLLG